MRAVAADVRGTPGVETVLTTAGGGFLGSVNTGYGYVRIAPHESALSSLDAALRAGCSTSTRWRRSAATTRSAT